MPLFATLQKTAAFSSSESSPTTPTATTPSSPHQPAFPPTAIQLYSSKYLHFLTSSILTTLPPTTSDPSPPTTSPNPSPPRSPTRSSASKSSSSSTKYLPLPHELLTYQAVQVPDTTASAAGGGGQWKRLLPKIRTLGVKTQSRKMMERHRSPNLGVWDVRSVEGGEERVAGLLRAVEGGEDGGDGVVTFVLTLDLEDVVGVCGVMKGMVRIVTNFLERDGGCSSSSSGKTTSFASFHTGTNTKKKGTTSLSQLKSVEFGAPLESSSSSSSSPPPPPSTTTTPPSNNDPCVNLILCAILPSPTTTPDTTTTTTYRDRQSQYLLSYHLQKYAADVNCTLCFVDSPSSSGVGEITPVATESFEEKEGEGEEGGGGGKVGKGMRPEGLDVDEVSVLVREVCIDPLPKVVDEDGDVVVLEDEEEKKENDGGDDEDDAKRDEEEGEGGGSKEAETNINKTQHYPSLYRPNHHDADLLHTVFLRNASCAGVWDASKDALWVALPPPSSSSSAGEVASSSATMTTAMTTTANDGGSDEMWLARLSDSVSGGGGSGGGDAGSVSGKSMRSGGSGGGNLGDFLGKLGAGEKGEGGGGSGKVGKEVGTGGEEKKKKRKGGKKKADSKDVADFFSDLLKK